MCKMSKASFLAQTIQNLNFLSEEEKDHLKAKLKAKKAIAFNFVWQFDDLTVYDIYVGQSTLDSEDVHKTHVSTLVGDRKPKEIAQRINCTFKGAIDRFGEVRTPYFAAFSKDDFKEVQD